MTEIKDESKQLLSRKPARIFWATIGCISVAIGGIGIVVPGLPTTVFMIIGASCFARSVRTMDSGSTYYRPNGKRL